MNAIPMNTTILAVVLIVVALGVVAWLVAQKQKSLKLRRRFGPEYDRAVNEFGGRAKAERKLKEREARVARLTLVPLTTADAARFSESWRALQGRFIDSPKGVVAEADLLVRELMLKRGYPMADFEHRVADISVDHPGVVETYRAAQAIATRDLRGEADTEELRKAVVHYRTLFDELLEVTPRAAERPAQRGILVHP
jgi:hypothetical protein